MKYRLLILILLICLLPHTTVAQHFHFKQYALEEGLPQSEVNTMAQDQFGYLWLGTNGGGLCRFNGKNFEVYTKKDGLFDNLILGIFHDKNYKLWIATPKGIQCYDGLRFNSVLASDTTCFVDNVTFCETQNGTIWGMARMISGENRLYKIENKVATNMTEALKESLQGKGSLLRIAPHGRNELLLSTTEQLFVLKKDQIVEYDKRQVAPNKKGLRLPLLRDRNKNLWISFFEDNGTNSLIMHTDGEGDNIIQLPQNIRQERIIRGYQDREGTYWFILYNAGVLKYSPKEGWLHFNKTNGLPINTVGNILQDGEGNIWLGTLGAGLVRYSGDLFVSLSRNNGLTDDIIRVIYQDSRGTYYFADGEGGFSTLKEGNIKRYPKQELEDMRAIRAFYELPSGKILMATINGLWEFNGHTVSPVNERYGLAHSVPINDIEVQKDTFFFASFNYGLIKSHRGQAIYYDKSNANMQDNNILSLFADSKQRLWLSTGRGIIQYNKGAFTPFLEGKDIPAAYIIQAAEDKAGNIWFASYTDGLLRYDGSQWQVFDTSKGMSANNIYSVIADAEGNIFAGAQNGIDKLSLSSRGKLIDITHYDRYDGFIGSENNGAANYLDKNGRLWFGTIKGAIRYNPMEKRTNFLAPPVYIRNIKLAYTQADWLSENYQDNYNDLVPWFGIPDQLELSSANNTISIGFDALCYSVPEKIKYRWRLDPIEDEWVEGNINTVTYPSLPSGDYTFRVIAANNSGIWNEEGASFQFSIHPEWYRTTSFRVLVIMLIIGLISSVVITWQQRTKVLRFELETLIAAKTKEINKQRKEIQNQNEQLKNQHLKIEKQAKSISDALNDLERLTDIGKILTANLSADSIFNLVYKAASEMMDTYLFGIGLYVQDTNTLNFNNVILNGERMPFITFPLDDVERLSIHCLIKNKEIYINDFEHEYKNYVQEIRPVPGDISSQSIIYIPLKVSDVPFGVITVQSASKKAYTAYHLNFLRNISIYTSIALENARAFSKLEEQRLSLEEVNKNAFEQNQLILKQQADVDRLNKENDHLITLFTQEMERPITSSVGLIGSIKNEDDVDEKEKDEALQYVFDALWQMKEMVNQVREIKRLESGPFALNNTTFNLLALMREVVAQHTELLAEKEIDIAWQAEDERIVSDYTLLEKIITNLLSNAIKFSPISATITLSLKPETDRLIMSIRDEGPGIEEDVLANLFTKYTKAQHGSGHRAPSSGLGLYIVKRYLDAIGGSISCDSTLGQGTTFNVILPK
ncbi:MULTISPECIES: sensor histidine kinase [unclassified Carboxylicivirga]|uniref:sensor histidine kinase n=1 Tax=Carboxylicivirga TaxID=1628153 RepID=UPI003D348405